MTAGIRSTMLDMTGYEVSTCPWRAFSDPFVRRVTAAVRWLGEGEGQLADFETEPSHKLIEGIAMYRMIDGRMRSKQMEMDRKEQQRAAEQARRQQ